MSVREYLATNLKPLLPASWVFYDYDKSISNIAKPTAVVVHKSLEPASETNALLHSISLIVYSPTQVEDNLDNSLDDLMEDLIPAIRSLPVIEFIKAEKGARNNFPCWDIQLRIKTI